MSVALSSCWLSDSTPSFQHPCLQHIGHSCFVKVYEWFLYIFVVELNIFVLVSNPQELLNLQRFYSELIIYGPRCISLHFLFRLKC